MIITITGRQGSGKTTIAKMLAKKLRYDYYSAGDARGLLALKLGITIDELNVRAETDHSLNLQFDKFIQQSGKKDKRVIEAWAGWFLLPQSYKLFLDVTPSEGARRIFIEQQQNARPDEPAYKSIAEAKKALAFRFKTSWRQFTELHGKQADFFNKKNYDLYVNTAGKTPQQVLQEIVNALPKAVKK